MEQNQTDDVWREHLVDKLQDRYGLTAEQAQRRAELWLQWIRQRAGPRSERPGGARPQKKSKGSFGLTSGPVNF